MWTRSMQFDRRKRDNQFSFASNESEVKAQVYVLKYLSMIYIDCSDGGRDADMRTSLH